MKYKELDSKTKQKLEATQLEILDEVVRVCEKHDIQYFLIGGTLLGAIRHQGFIPWDDDVDIAMTRSDYNKFIEVAKIELNDNFYMHNIVTDHNYWNLFTKIRKNNTEFVIAETVDLKTHKGVSIDIFPYDNVNTIDGFGIKLQSLLKLVTVGAAHYKSGIIKDFKKIQYWYIACLFLVFSKKTLMRIGNLVITWNKNDNSDYLVNLSGPNSYKRESIPRAKLFPLKKVEFEKKDYYAINDTDYYLNKMYGDYMKLPPKNERINHAPVKISFNKGASWKNNEVIR